MSPTQANTDELQGSGSRGEHGGYAVDPDLVALPAPPQGRRLGTLTVMAAAVVAAMAMCLSLKGDMAYSAAEAQPIQLGHVRDLKPETAPINTYVTVQGNPTIAQAVRFSRPLRGRYRMFSLAGQRNLFVQVADAPGAMARGSFTGRLVRFADLGARYTPVWTHLAEQQGQPVTRNSLVLLADEPPSDYYWTWLIALFCLAFIALDSYLIIRWFRPLPWAHLDDESPGNELEQSE